MTVQQQILSALTCAALKSVARSNRVSIPLGAHKEDMVACLCALPIERLASSLDDHSLRVSLGALSRAVVGDTAMLRKRLLQAARTRQALHAERDPATEPPLRLYQTEAVEALLQALATRGQPVCMQLPTGAGKTRTAVVLLDRWARSVGGRVLWVTKDWELLRQAATVHKALYPNANQGRVGGDAQKLPLPQAGLDVDVAYCTVQTFRNRVDWSAVFFGVSLVVWDECHWGHDAKVGDSLFDFCQKEGIPMLGLTATPKASKHFHVAYRQTFPELVNQGYLARPIVEEAVPTGVHWAPELRATGDFSPASLARLGEDAARNALVVSHYLKQAATYGPTIVFACNIAHANCLVQLFRRKGVTVAPLHSQVDEADRQSFLNQYRRGAVKVLVNVEMLTHGVDLPETQTVFLCRPTRSEILFAQMVGRGARVSATKTEFHVVEFADNLLRHGELLVRPHHIFSGGDSRKDGCTRRSYTALHVHNFDPAGLPVWIPSEPTIPAPVQGLWYRRGQTFGIEFEMTRLSGFPDDPRHRDWMEPAKAILDALRTASPRVAAAPLPFYAGTDATRSKDMTVWNVEYDRSAGWEVTSPILADEAGFLEVFAVCNALDAVATQLGLRVNRNTGTHVHLGWKGRPLPELCQLIRLTHLAEPALGTLVAPSRIAAFDGEQYSLHAPNRYCQPISRVVSGSVLGRWQSPDDVARTFEHHETRYITLNLRSIRSIGTVEVRMHSGTLDGGKILLWVSLWQQILWAASAHDVVPDEGPRHTITPHGDIIEFAHRWLPNAADPAQQRFIGRLRQRRAEVLIQWKRHANLAPWLPLAAGWEASTRSDAPAMAVCE